MTDKLNELFNLDDPKEAKEAADKYAEEYNEEETQQSIEESKELIKATNDAIDKIDAAMPGVESLEAGDKELDDLSQLAQDKFEDLINLGMNVEARYSGTILQTAATLLGTAVSAKEAKINRKLKTIDLQLKKLRIDKMDDKSNNDANKVINAEDGEGQIIDRTELLRELKRQNGQN